MNLPELLKQLPKIELHAHLTGSVRQSTIIELLKADLISKHETHFNIEKELDKYRITDDKSLEDCFAIFSLLHRLLNNKENLIRVTKEVLNDFKDENTAYLELRTTPRAIADPITNEIILNKSDYITTILNVIKEFEVKNEMLVRLILSIDRSKPIADAYETIELCKSLKNDSHVVGIDISGNPVKSDLKLFADLFNIIKSNDIKLTVHIAETVNSKEETEYIFKHIKPDRIGHAVFLNDDLRDYLFENPIPIEICPTSNLITKSVDSIEQHPFIDFYQQNKSYPMCICTDDCGMFNTNITDEHILIAKTFSLNVNDMFNLNKQSIGFIFDQSIDTLNKLKLKFELYNEKYLV